MRINMTQNHSIIQVHDDGNSVVHSNYQPNFLFKEVADIYLLMKIEEDFVH